MNIYKFNKLLLFIMLLLISGYANFSFAQTAVVSAQQISVEKKDAAAGSSKIQNQKTKQVSTQTQSKLTAVSSIDSNVESLVTGNAEPAKHPTKEKLISTKKVNSSTPKK